MDGSNYIAGIPKELEQDVNSLAELTNKEKQGGKAPADSAEDKQENKLPKKQAKPRRQSRELANLLQYTAEMGAAEDGEKGVQTGRLHNSELVAFQRSYMQQRVEPWSCWHGTHELGRQPMGYQELQEVPACPSKVCVHNWECLCACKTP